MAGISLGGVYVAYGALLGNPDVGEVGFIDIAASDHLIASNGGPCGCGHILDLCVCE